jgi:esterase
MQLNYKQYSTQGKPLLVLHGLFGSLANWGWHSKQLASHFAVYAVDLRNHGESPHADAMNYEVMAEDVKQLLQHLQIDSCYMIGHSMGGKVAMQLALTAPELIERLLVVDIAPVTYPAKADGHLGVLAGMKAVDPAAIKNRAEAEQLLEPYIEDEATRRFVLTNLVRQDDGKYKWRLNLLAIEKHYDRLREKPGAGKVFAGPTLFVKGDLSRYLQKKHEPEILEMFPAASVKIIMETGHWLHAEKPQVFQKIALDFFNRDQD